jgi:hypothetical protein
MILSSPNLYGSAPEGIPLRGAFFYAEKSKKRIDIFERDAIIKSNT